MPQPINRRGFITTFLLVTAAPSTLANKSPYGASLTIPPKSMPDKFTPIDNKFVSVNGWILPTITLTRGAE